MLLIDLYSQLSNTTLQRRCEAAILKNAPSIARESMAVPFHVERRALALRVLNSGVAWGEWQRWVVSDGVIIGAANPAAVDSLSDAAIESLVLTIWNIVAGIPPADVP